MPEMEAIDWLDWHSSRTAQDYAVRLSMACSAVVPSDKNRQRLIEEQIIADLIGFAIHGRRAMERRGMKSASLSTDSLWPASKVDVPEGVSLWDAFGSIVHAVDLKVEWECPDITPNPYKGRETRFAGSVKIKSDKKEMKLPIGSMVASFFGNFQNKAVGQ